MRKDQNLGKVKPKVVILIQARMGSTRLPGKHLKTVLDKPLLAFLLERLKRVTQVDEIILATTTNPVDDCLAEFCQLAQCSCFRGSEQDVFQRFLEAARCHQATVIIRICADCPLIDPAIIQKVLDYFLAHEPSYDYITNCLQEERSYPRGMDVEVFSVRSLEYIATQPLSPEEREHVTPYYYRHTELFSLKSLQADQNFSTYRWTVDTPADLNLITLILENIYPQKPQFTLEDLLELLKQHPEWCQLNAHIQHKIVGSFVL